MRNILVVLLLVVLASCEFNANFSVRSGDMQNDYVEEPISATVIKYAETLATANLFIELIKNSDYPKAYKLFDKNIQNQLSENEFETLLTKNAPVIGKINEFKKNQWSFDFESIDKIDFVRMTKIVKHEKIVMHYIFLYAKNSDYSKIQGFSFREKTDLL